MSQTADLEALLRRAIRQAKETAPRVADDLFRCASDVAAAVDRVTDGTVKLELVDAADPAGEAPTFFLQLFRAGSEAPPTDLGVYALAEAGYPVQRWVSRRQWESQSQKPDHLFQNRPELEHHFEWLISQPESRLVTLIAYLQGDGVSAGASTKPARPPRSK